MKKRVWPGPIIAATLLSIECAVIGSPRKTLVVVAPLVFCVFNVHLFLRQRETENEQGRVRERETQNLKQAPGSELSAQSLTWGSNSRTARSRPEPKSAA